MSTNNMVVGDVVMVRKSYGEKPVKANVDKVTKTGRVNVTVQFPGTVGDRKIQFQGMSAVGEPKYGGCPHAQMVPFSEEKMAEWTADYERQQARIAEKKAADEARRVEQAARKAAEMAETKDACVGLINCLKSKDVMPDGSRVYTLDIPVHPNYAERKGGWERIIVRCKDLDRSWFDDEGEVRDGGCEAAHTCCNGSSYSFASCSTERHPTDEAAIWSAVDRQYHNW